MRSEASFGNGFVLSCPVSAAGDSPVRDIRKRGNIPLVLQEDMVIELKRSDMLESWQTTCAMGRAKAKTMMEQVANRISSAIQDDDTCEIGELASDMAAFFLLAVRDKGMDVMQASRFCEMAWRANLDERLSIKRY